MKTTKEEIEGLEGKFFVFVRNSDFPIEVSKGGILELLDHVSSIYVGKRLSYENSDYGYFFSVDG